MKCKLCNSTLVKKFKVVRGQQIMRCSSCRLAFQKNFKTTTQLDSLYSYSEYRKNENKIKSRLYNLSQLIGSYKGEGSLLEIGAGFGLFSAILKSKYNYTIDIVEPSLKPIYLKDTECHIYKIMLDQFLAKNKRKYDLIIMMDVIEHLENPIKTIKLLKNCLNMDGLLVIQTPNYQSFMQNIVNDWSWWMVEDHKWFFSPISLKTIMSEVGLKVIHFHSYEDWSDFKSNIDGNFKVVKNSVTRRICKGIFFLFFIPIYFSIRKLIWLFGRGGLMFVISKNEK